ncbi:3-hydroxyisobutyrate dehydrogenase [Fusarium sp. NRRL 25303]|nr:3-hydroxyisobutyrate dehydrogenase [Fusarium sp. NRRL 25303]
MLHAVLMLWPGLGVMGYPMAVNLIKGLGASKSFLIADVNQEALHNFQDEVKGFGKVSVVQNGYEATKAADTVITMLPTATAVEAVYLDPNTGILAGAVAAVPDGNPAKKLFIECGTIETATIKKVAKTTEEVSSKLSDTLSFVDAPVSGGPMGAIDGSLTFMVGVYQPKSAKTFPQVEALLKHMGKSIFQCGDAGAGTAFKIINNYLSAITSVAAAEALNIGVKAGLDPKLLSDVINVSGGQCWVTSKANPVPGVMPNVPSSNGYLGGFRIELCEKVLQMGSMLAEDVGAKTVLDGPAKQAFQEAMRDERYKGVVRDERNVGPLLEATCTLVFEKREGLTDPCSLRYLFTTACAPRCMTEKLDVARELAKSVSYGHTFGFVYRDVRPETALTLEEAKTSSRSTFLVGFGNFHRKGRTYLRNDGDWTKDLYRHPKCQGPAPRTDYIMQHDIFSLGVCLLEIGYAQVVHTCLTCLDPDNIDFGPEAEFQDEYGIRVGVGFCSG